MSLLVPAEAGRFRWGRLLARVNFLVRRIVVVTAHTPLRHFYRAVYRWHIWFAARVARRFPGTRAVYVTRSIAKGDLVIGVSDVDMVMVGEWPEEEQIRLMRALGTLTAISPLFDSGLWQQVHCVDTLRNLWETDYFFQSRFDEGRTQWKLIYGEDIVAGLPPIPAARVSGCYYMEARNWWLHLIASIFGSGPTARDSIFCNSIAYKAVIEIAGIARVLRTGSDGVVSTRPASLRSTIEESTNSKRDFLERLERSALNNHLRFAGDIQRESVDFLLPLLDQIHKKLQGMPPFVSVSEFRVDAPADEVLRMPAVVEHVRRLVAHVKEQWPGYRAASMAPSASSFALDDLMLLIAVDPDRIPSLIQLRELCKLHAGARASLPQRVSIYLLLPSGACQLDIVNFTEMWRVMVFPPSAPDLFALMDREEFRIDGDPASTHSAPVWSRFARDLAIEELNVRRSVLSRITPNVFPSSLEIIRNVYRHLQLEVLLSGSPGDVARFALSPAAIERGLQSMGMSDIAITGPLEEAYRRELLGEPSDVRPMVPQILTFLRKFTSNLRQAMA